MQLYRPDRYLKLQFAVHQYQMRRLNNLAGSIPVKYGLIYNLPNPDN